MNKKTIIGIGIAALIALSFGIYMGVSSKPSDDVSFDRYTESSLGLSFEHPSHWYVRKMPDPALILLVRDKADTKHNPDETLTLEQIAVAGGVSNIGNITNIDPPQTEEAYRNHPIVTEFFVKDVEIGGKTWMEFKIPDSSSDITRVEYRFVDDQTVYIFSPYPYGRSEEQYSNDRALLMEMLETVEVKNN